MPATRKTETINTTFNIEKPRGKRLEDLEDAEKNHRKPNVLEIPRCQVQVMLRTAIRHLEWIWGPQKRGKPGVVSRGLTLIWVCKVCLFCLVYLLVVFRCSSMVVTWLLDFCGFCLQSDLAVPIYLVAFVG